MTKHVLITGGAGFIGSHLARELLNAGYAVRALDNLDRQVHPTGTRPDYLEKDVELVVGDVRNVECVQKALVGIDMVCHLAAKVGVGQSMYEIVHYTQVNEIGTAVLLEQLAQSDPPPAFIEPRAFGNVSVECQKLEHVLIKRNFLLLDQR